MFLNRIQNLKPHILKPLLLPFQHYNYQCLSYMATQNRFVSARKSNRPPDISTSSRLAGRLKVPTQNTPIFSHGIERLYYLHNQAAATQSSMSSKLLCLPSLSFVLQAQMWKRLERESNPLVQIHTYQFQYPLRRKILDLLKTRLSITLGVVSDIP